jgi:uncharacterized protein (DUF2225 family)
MENLVLGEEEKKPVISYYTKDKITCPVCRGDVRREEMLSGGGRVIAGPLTDELRRTYQPSVKYGQIYPTTYSIGACPQCHSAFFWNDFKLASGQVDSGALLQSQDSRMASVEAVFPHYNLDHNRTVKDAAAMYYLALFCYDHLDKNFSPTIKKAICALRLAWLSGDLDALYPGHNYGFVQGVFYKKALFYYSDALDREMESGESISEAGMLGPDTDKNYGYDGVIYLHGLLEYKYGRRDDMNLHLKNLDAHKRAIARLFGLGKASKNKPGPLLEHARALYESISRELKEANMPGLGEDDE